jgi:LacI family transcriptional regulator/LacI family repressor for deo operon, udp, cdd, tsx, nupC, and nupG
MPKPVSIKDIARAAGVSPSTVSRALRNHPRIGKDTTSRIHQLAKDLRYTPSLPARSLVTRDTTTIGLVISHASDPFLGRLVEGVEEAARLSGYSVLLISAYRDADRERGVVQALYERRVTGVIVTGSQIDAGYLELRERFPMPIVLINCPDYPYSVSADNEMGASQAVEHLVELGHRRIGYLANPQSCGTDLARLTGYKKVLAEHGIPFDERLVAGGDGTLRAGAQAARQLLSLSQAPTALFCFNDMAAMGAIHALSRADRSVPGDCSVIGFDDLELSAYCSPPLTTVRQPTCRMGQRAMDLLLGLIQGQSAAQAEVLPATLVVRESTGPAPRSSKGKGRR